MPHIPFLKTLKKTELAALAASCGTEPIYLRQIRNDSAKASEKLAVAIERETQGAVTCEELRPDVGDWSMYLRFVPEKKSA